MTSDTTLLSKHVISSERAHFCRKQSFPEDLCPLVSQGLGPEVTEDGRREEGEKEEEGKGGRGEEISEQSQSLAPLPEALSSAVQPF